MIYLSEKERFYREKFDTSHLLEDFLSFFSAYVWRRMKFFAQHPDVISRTIETELTSQLVNELAMLIQEARIPLPIRIQHSTNEKANGSDLEIVLPIGSDQNIRFVCQAKKLYVNKNRKDLAKADYDAIWHPPKGEKPQIIALREYATQVRAWPIYLLYNYTEEKAIDADYPENEMYGCSIVSADYVAEKHFLEEWTKDLTFRHLHPPAKPLTTITQCGKVSLLPHFWGQCQEKRYVHVLSDDKIFNEAGWIELNPPADSPPKRFVSSIDLKSLLLEGEDIGDQDFNPKFRIVVRSEPIYHRRRNFSL